MQKTENQDRKIILLPINERIKAILKALNLSEYAFAKELGYATNSTIRGIVQGRDAQVSTLEKILIRWPQINPAFLMTGKGEVFSEKVAPKVAPNSHLNEVNEPQLPYERTITVTENGIQNIILIDQKAAAGYTQGVRDTDYVESLPAFHMPGLSNNNFRAFELEGDSMEPTLWQGDWLICQQIETIKEVREGYVHIVILNDGSIVAKRAVFESGGLLLKSDNRAYPPFKVKREEIFEVWKAVRRVTSYLSAPQNLDVRLTSLEYAFKDVQDQIKVLLKHGKKGN